MCISFPSLPPKTIKKKRALSPSQREVKLKGTKPQPHTHKPTLKVERNTLPENPHHFSKPTAKCTVSSTDTTFGWPSSP